MSAGIGKLPWKTCHQLMLFEEDPLVSSEAGANKAYNRNHSRTPVVLQPKKTCHGLVNARVRLAAGTRGHDDRLVRESVLLLLIQMSMNGKHETATF
jgi:hypothetical protein